jgi:2-oxoisovalerate dehydrogenase E1 component
MSKELLIDPATTRSRSQLNLGSIQVNAYEPNLGRERKKYGDEALERIGRDMLLVREFELMLNSIKREGSYRGVDYVHAGPAHLSIGQEASAVGQAFTLGLDDKVFGSHRSHGEVIAKGLSAISKSTADSLNSALQGWSNGAIWDVVTKHLPDADFEQQAINYLLYGMTAETFGRRTGFNRGLGGSMHAFFPPLGIYPNNAIVGGSGPLATGAGLYNRLQGKPGIVVASIGDASTGTGPVWESFNLASMAQLYTLMDEKHRGGAPVVFFVVNNFYGMGGQTIGETMAYERLARIGSGINANNMHAQTIDGNNPLAVIDAMASARDILERGDGPVLIDCQTYRQSGHSPSDASSYRTKDEVDLWSAVDPISTYFERLAEGGVFAATRHAELKAWAESKITASLELAINQTVSPRLELRKDPTVMAGATFNNRSPAAPELTPGETLVPLDELPHFVAIGKKSRVGIVDGKALSGAKAVTFRDALFEAVATAAAQDDRLTMWGEENRD